MHLGFDRSAYPGDGVMQSLWDSTPLGYVGVYLAPAPSHSNTAWMSKVDSSGTAQTLPQVDLDTAVCTDPSNPLFPTPAVTSLTAPGGASGLPSGTAGDTIGVEGSDFDGVIDVAFGTVSAANVAVTSDTHIEAVVPSGITGVVDVIVSNRWGLQNPPGTQFEIT
jgi:hypothetical protein